jgi:hypothetical protein
MAQGPRERDDGVVIVNFTPQVYSRGRVKVPLSGAAFRRLARGPNTDTAIYGGRDVRNAAGMETLKGSPIPEVTLVVPTFAAVFLVPEE